MSDSKPKSSKPSKALGDILSDQGSTLANLMKRANQALNVEQFVLQHLDADARAHCQLVTVRRHTLVLQTETAAWATRIRFQQAEVVKQLKQTPAFSEITRIEVKIRPQAKRQKEPQRAKPLSSDSAHFLTETADSFGDDPLAEALKRLAKHTSK